MGLLERALFSGNVGVCVEHIYKCLLSVLSEVELSWGASAKLPGRRPPTHWTGRGQLSKGDMFGELRVLLFVSFRSVHGWMGVDYSCAQTLDHGESWLGTSAKLPGRRPPSHWTGRGQTKAFSLVSWAFCSLFALGVCMGGLVIVGMDVWVNVLRMPFLCADSRPCLGPDLQCPG